VDADAAIETWAVAAEDVCFRLGSTRPSLSRHAARNPEVFVAGGPGLCSRSSTWTWHRRGCGSMPAWWQPWWWACRPRGGAPFRHRGCRQRWRVAIAGGATVSKRRMRLLFLAKVALVASFVARGRRGRRCAS